MIFFLKRFISITQVLILCIFSMELEFLPGYIHHPDKWHVFLPYLVFLGILIVQSLWSIGFMISHRKIYYALLINLIVSFLTLQLLMETNNVSEIIGFVLLLIICIGFIIHTVITERKQKHV